MIAHLFSKVYLNFDSMLRPTFDTLIVSSGNFAVHESFINKHFGMGTSHGRFATASEVNWPEFFSNLTSNRTVVYADPLAFATIYFSFLKTVKPTISFDNAKKVLEIILKRAEFYYIEYDAFGGGHGAGEPAELLKQKIQEVRSNYEQAWADSQPWALDSSFVENNLGIEFLVAKYWANGTNEQPLKEKLEAIWWKVFVGWGEESMKQYSIRWLHQNPGTTPEMFLSQISTDPNLSWMADPNLDLEKTHLFRQTNNWSAVEKIFAFLLSDQDRGLIIETEPHWATVVSKDWNKILDKADPMALIVPASEPVYRVLINSWLISYFANTTTDKLKEFV